MSFTTAMFIFVFLPITILIYFASYFFLRNAKAKHLNRIFIVICLVFYSWALAINAILLVLYVGIVFMLGRLLGKDKSDQHEKKYDISGKPILIVGVFISICILFFFKYAPSLAELLSPEFLSGMQQVGFENIIVPLGISFITFSTISYYVDIYRGDATSGHFEDCLLYIVFFPKVISGPVVLWKEFQPQLQKRSLTSESIAGGINQIMIGFAKKVLLADTFARCIDKIAGIPVDMRTAWMGLFLYAFQIYFDFSGYSDIAIGLSRIFGFEFTPNFNFPYRSLSITEFWRRWHISLGAFFRTYVYIPLGGNRKGRRRTLINLLIVFVLTGIWHGVGAAYLIWGLIHGVCIVTERMIQDQKWYKVIPSLFKWMVTFLIVACAWQFFYYGGDGTEAIAAIGRLFGIHFSYTKDAVIFPLSFYLDAKTVTAFVVAVLGATVAGSQKVQSLYLRFKEKTVFLLAERACLFALFALALVSMITSTYNPFIYFQF